MILTPVSRRAAPVGGAFINWGADLWSGPVVFAAPSTVGWDEGAWINDVVFGASATPDFDTDYGQTTIRFECGVTATGFDTSPPLVAAVPVSSTPALGFYFVVEANADPVRFAVASTPAFWPAVRFFAASTADIAAQTPAADTAYCYNLRMENGPEATAFLNFSLLAVVKVNGANYAVRSDGLHLIGGETDNGEPVNASFTLNPLLAANGVVARCPWVHAALSAPADIYAQIDTDGSEEYAEHGPYRAAKSTGNARRAQLGRGAASAWWRFRVESVNGERLKAASLQFDFEPTTRRV